MSSDCQFWISFSKDLVIALLAAFVAFKGLDQWKKQIRGEKIFELSYSLLLSLQRYKLAQKEIRNLRVYFADTLDILKKEYTKGKNIGWRSPYAQPWKSKVEFILYKGSWLEFENSYKALKENILRASLFFGKEFSVLSRDLDEWHVRFSAAREFIRTDLYGPQNSEIQKIIERFFPIVIEDEPQAKTPGRDFDKSIEKVENYVNDFVATHLGYREKNSVKSRKEPTKKATNPNYRPKGKNLKKVMRNPPVKR